MVVNQQKKISVDLAAIRGFVRRLRRVLDLSRRDFNVCLTDDRAIGRLNAAYRGRARPTDVLSFPWDGTGEGPAFPAPARDRGSWARKNGAHEFDRFLGDIVISVENARYNARKEGQSAANEIRWLILHGVLHLLGFNHETDQGEMTARELALRERLGIAGTRMRRARRVRGR